VTVNPRFDTTSVGDNVIFECKISKEVKYSLIVWYYNGDDLLPNVKVETPTQLLIENVRPENTGIYTCEVEVTPGTRFMAHGRILVLEGMY